VVAMTGTDNVFYPFGTPASADEISPNTIETHDISLPGSETLTTVRFR
jgi:hypothetical protein